jgi:hypothetical protein
MPPLPPEDLPPSPLTDRDATLRRQLELSTRQHFWDACDRGSDTPEMFR